MTASKGKVRVKCQGPGCGKTFHSARSTAKFCCSACRSRARRQPAAPAGEHKVVAATRKELGDAVESLAGQLALQLAERVANGGSVSMIRELRSLVAEAKGKPEPSPSTDATDADEQAEPDDEVTRARKRVEAMKQAAAG